LRCLGLGQWGGAWCPMVLERKGKAREYVGCVRGFFMMRCSWALNALKRSSKMERDICIVLGNVKINGNFKKSCFCEVTELEGHIGGG
jgi:hypothetical protein